VDSEFSNIAFQYRLAQTMMIYQHGFVCSRMTPSLTVLKGSAWVIYVTFRSRKRALSWTPSRRVPGPYLDQGTCSAIFSNTAIVARLCQSSNPSQPTVFHGNSCAHEMNVSSVATVLPQVPSDVNDLLLYSLGRKSSSWNILEICTGSENQRSGGFSCDSRYTTGCAQGSHWTNQPLCFFVKTTTFLTSKPVRFTTANQM